MSRSCQSATSSSAGTTAARTTRASPQRFSLRIGLRLWGIALEPFWPDRERLLGLADLAALPVAHVRREPLDRRRERARAPRRTPRADRARRSASPPSRARARALPSARASISGDRCAYVPTAPAILPTAISRARRREPRAAARDLGVVPREREAEGDRLGEDAVAAADHRRLRVLAGARGERARGARRTARGACPPRRAAGSRGTCRARRSTSSRGGASARRCPRAPRRA